MATKKKPFTSQVAAQQPTERENLKAAYQRWQNDFCAFFEEVLKVQLTNQQRAFLDDLRDMVWAKIKASQKQQLTEREKELAFKVGISIHSGKGLGKDFTVAGVIILFVMLFDPFKGICTATSSKQLEDVLSTEVKKLIKRNPEAHLDNLLLVDKGGIYLKDAKGKKSENFMSKRTANVKASAEENADTLQGYHEDFMLMVADEASGIPDAVFKPLETTLTGLCNIAILIGNVMKGNGYFYQSHYGAQDSKLWHKVRWNAEDSDLELIKPGLAAQIERIATKYGKNSNAYRMNVQGLPPLAEEDALIPLDWIYAARDRWPDMDVDPDYDPTFLGVDVGRGGDESAIAHRIGGKVTAVQVKDTHDLNILGDWLDSEMDIFEADKTLVDSNGMGASFCDTFRRFYNRQITEVNVGTGASNSDQYYCLRDELWFRVKEAFANGKIAIPNDEELILELSAIKVKEWNNPKKIESKKQMKARGVKSPNRADAVMHTYFFRDVTSERMAETRDRYRDRTPLGGKRNSSTSWMVV